MMYLKGIVWLIVAIVANGEKTCRQKLQNTIIPRYAKSVKDTTALNVTFPSGESVNCGNYIAFRSTLSIPTVTYDVAGQCENTTVLFIGIPYNIYDTDALVGYPYRHWLVHNVPASNLKQGFNGDVGDTKTTFLMPLNPTSDHQYTFLVYCQQKFIRVERQKNDPVTDRPSFNPRKFAKRYELGDPLAINYFISSLANGEPLPPSIGK